jgi:outer membrane biosynthesis protein TonB
MARSRTTRERRAFALSLVLHAAIFVLGWMSTLYQPEVIEFATIQIELVSPPPTTQADVREVAAEELVVERPVETRPEPEPEPEPTPPPPEETEPEPEPEPEDPEPEPEPEPQPATPAQQPQPPVEEEPRRATTTETPPEDATVSGEDINVRLEGLRRDYPAYYDNIIRQIQRCFRWQGSGSWETTIRFAIRRDGTATDIEFASRSGNTSFDFTAMGAIECAGQGRFGPLPDDLPYDRLPIQFNFRPTGMER